MPGNRTQNNKKLQPTIQSVPTCPPKAHVLTSGSLAVIGRRCTAMFKAYSNSISCLARAVSFRQEPVASALMISGLEPG